jgi:hypothetical protein
MRKYWTLQEAAVWVETRSTDYVESASDCVFVNESAEDRHVAPRRSNDDKSSFIWLRKAALTEMMEELRSEEVGLSGFINGARTREQPSLLDLQDFIIVQLFDGRGDPRKPQQMIKLHLIMRSLIPFKEGDDVTYALPVFDLLSQKQLHFKTITDIRVQSDRIVKLWPGAERAKVAQRPSRHEKVRRFKEIVAKYENEERPTRDELRAKARKAGITQRELEGLITEYAPHLKPGKGAPGRKRRRAN